MGIFLAERSGDSVKSQFTFSKTPWYVYFALWKHTLTWFNCCPSCSVLFWCKNAIWNSPRVLISNGPPFFTSTVSLVSCHYNHMLMSSESAVEQHNELNASKASHLCIKRTTSQSNSEWSEQYEQFCITVTVIVIVTILQYSCFSWKYNLGNTKKVLVQYSHVGMAIYTMFGTICHCNLILIQMFSWKHSRKVQNSYQLRLLRLTKYVQDFSNL